MAQVGTADWQSLLNQSEELISQDFHNYPRINRNIQQLQNYAENFRARTSRLRTIDNQLAATRLLAQQGFDASRLTKDVTSIALQPSVEDVFPADETANVWEYLDQVHKATVLTVVQEAQQDVITSFEHYIEDCMERDWAADKKHLFSDFVPHTGVTPAPSGAGMLGGVRAGGIMGLASAAQVTSSDKEKAYNAVVRRLNQALVQGRTFDASKEFLDACKSFEDASKPDTMANLWELLNNILSDVKARRGSLTAPEQYMDALIAGTRKYLESAHVQHMKAVLQRHPVQAERGTTLDALAEVQAFLRVRFHTPSRPLDIVTPGGQDTSWLQVYFCLRNGAYESARQAAARASDNYAPRLGSGGLEPLLDEWVKGGGRLPPSLAERVSREGERLLREKAQRSGQLKWPFQVMVHALLSKDNRLVDAILRESSELVKTLEDYMWLKISVVAPDPGPTPSSSGAGASVPPYLLHSLHTDINRWPSGHYTKEGKQPMLYATVLLLSLQFHKAVKYLSTDESTGAFRIDAVHLAIALQAEKVLDSMTGEAHVGGSQIGELLHRYASKFMRADSTTALQYLMLAAAAHGGSVEVKGRLLQELLIESGDYGSLLGSGGPLGSGGALSEYLPDPTERRALLEAIAFECTMAAHSEVAVELFMAAGRPALALQMLNQAISARLESVTQPHAAVLGTSLEQLVRRGRDAADKIGSTTSDDFARREVEAYEQLLTIRDLLVASASGNHPQALQKLSELSFIPLERSLAQARAEAVPRLHPAVADRLQSVLTAAATSIAARRQAPLAAAVRADLKEKLDVLVQYVNFIPALRIPTTVYQKLCEAGSML